MSDLIVIDTIDFPSEFGSFDLTIYETHYKDQPKMTNIIAIKTKELEKIPYIRMQSSCLFGEAFGLNSCDCRQQVIGFLKFIAKKGGILFQLDQECWGHGIIEKVKAMKLEEEGKFEEVESKYKDIRSFKPVADILKIMKINEVNLVSKNPKKAGDLRDSGIIVNVVTQNS
jgi:GTP cyclohydrolase II